MSHRRVLIGLFGLALAARTLVAALTAIPGRDAAHYLWMAEQAAAGHASALFQTVFHPGYSMLVAGPVALGLGIEPFRWGQIVALTAGAMAILPLHAITRRLYDERTAFWAALLYAIGTWFCRHPADALSEGPFYLCVALWAERLIDSKTVARVAVAGVAAALAYACRPEGAVLPIIAVIWLVSNGRLAECGWMLFAFAICATPLPIGWALAGDGFTLTPKAAFNYDVGVGSGGIAHYASELAKLPGAALEDLGFLILPLAVLGAIRGRVLTAKDPRFLLALPFLAQCLVIPLLRAHYRFVSGFGILLLPLAAAATLELVRALGNRRRLVIAGLAVLIAIEAVRLPQPRRYDRIVLLDLGRWIGSRLQPGETIATDMPRLAYFAGLRPPEPRPIAPREILASARLTTTRFIVVVRRRTPLPDGALESLGFRSVVLPQHLADLVERRDATVFERTP